MIIKPTYCFVPLTLSVNYLAFWFNLENEQTASEVLFYEAIEDNIFATHTFLCAN